MATEVVEYIKRNQRMGFRGDDLVYKVYEEEPSPLAEYNTEEVAPVTEYQEPETTGFGLFGKQ